MILKKFPFESCVSDFIISHSFSNERYEKYAQNKTDDMLRRNTAALSLIIFTVENQTLLLSCTVANNCR